MQQFTPMQIHGESGPHLSRPQTQSHDQAQGLMCQIMTIYLTQQQIESLELFGLGASLNPLQQLANLGGHLHWMQSIKGAMGQGDELDNWLRKHQVKIINYTELRLDMGHDSQISQGMMVPMLDKLTAQTYSVQYRSVETKVSLQWMGHEQRREQLAIQLVQQQADPKEKAYERQISDQTLKTTLWLEPEVWHLVGRIDQLERKKKKKCISKLEKLPIIGKLFCLGHRYEEKISLLLTLVRMIKQANIPPPSK